MSRHSVSIVMALSGAITFNFFMGVYLPLMNSIIHCMSLKRQYTSLRLKSKSCFKTKCFLTNFRIAKG